MHKIKYYLNDKNTFQLEKYNFSSINSFKLKNKCLDEICFIKYGVIKKTIETVRLKEILDFFNLNIFLECTIIKKNNLMIISNYSLYINCDNIQLINVIKKWTIINALDKLQGKFIKHSGLIWRIN